MVNHRKLLDPCCDRLPVGNLVKAIDREATVTFRCRGADVKVHVTYRGGVEVTVAALHRCRVSVVSVVTLRSDLHGRSSLTKVSVTPCNWAYVNLDEVTSDALGLDLRQLASAANAERINARLAVYWDVAHQVMIHIRGI